MGNIELKTAFKNALKDQGAKEKLGFTAEILFEDELVTVMEDFVKEKMGVAALEKEKAFPESNIQTNENAEDIYKRQLISELNENYISGFATAESNVETLKEPSFEKYFTVNSPDIITDYTKLQQQKFVILYALFVEKFREQQDKKQNFFEYIQKFLEKSDVTQRAQVGLESGFKFSLSLLKEIKSINKDMLVNSLEYLYQTLRYAEPGSLYSTDKLSFMIDSNLNDARTFLVSIIEDSQSGHSIPPRAVELAFKILFLLGVVRSNVEDFLMVSTLLTKYGKTIQVDLRQEFDLLKEEDNTTTEPSQQKKNFEERQISKQGNIFYLKKNPLNEKSSFTGDGQYLYLHQEGLGLIKFSAGGPGQMMGQIFQVNSSYRSGEKVYMMHLNNKLYVRAEGLKPKPFAVLNSVTFEEEKEEFELEKEDKNLEWKSNDDTGRSLTDTPLLTDGTYIYVIAQQKAPKKKEDNKEGEEENESDKNKPPMLAVECYDPSTPSFQFVKSVLLYTNADFQPFIKNSNSADFIKNSQFATNGQIFYIQREKKAYFFDMKTGILIQKVSLQESERASKVYFDFHNSIFYTIKEKDSIKMEAFTISNFKKIGASSGFAKQFLSSRLQKFRAQMLGEQEQQIDSSNINIGKLNLIQRIMKNVTTPVLIQHNRDSQRVQSQADYQPQYIGALILRHIEKACHSFNVALDELTAQGKSSGEAEEHMMKFFKFPNATYLTHTLFQQIQENLERYGQLVDLKKTVENLPDQYSLYFILNILTANFKALSFCSISLPDIMDQEMYQKFLHSYKSCIVHIIEKGYTQDFEEGEHEQEMKMLWQEMYQNCLNILSTSINLIYADSKEIIKNLLNYLAPADGQALNEKQAENCSISLNFLSMPENSKKLLQADSEELQLIIKVFGECCQIKSKDIIRIIEANPLGKIGNKDQAPFETLVQASSKFIRGLSEQLIVQFCALSETVASKQQVSLQTSERDERDKKKLKEYDNMIAYFFEHASNEISQSIKTLVNSLKNTLENKKDDEWEGIADQFEKYSTFMDSIFSFQSSFYQIITLYVQTFSVFKLKVNLIAPICQSTINIIKQISEYYSITKKFSEKLNLAEDKDKLRKCLNQFSRNLTWFIGMISYKLIKVKEPEKDQDKKDKESPSEKMQELIISSNLLSGGIENRFLYLFSNEVQQTLQDLVKISGDDQLQTMLRQKTKIGQEDEFLMAIINEGKNEAVDKTIYYLQQILEKKVPFVPYARLGGADGYRISRAAFAVMIKFSEFFEDFTQMVDEVDLNWEELKNADDKDVKMKECIKTINHYEQIAKRWDSASKMRQWINEKKKNLIERIKKEVEVEYQKKKEEDKQKKQEEEDKKKKEEEDKKAKEGEAKKEEIKVEDIVIEQKKEEGEQIDTSSKKEPEVVAQPEAQSGLTEEDKLKIDEIADNKYTAELNLIFSKIIEKAEFLTKLQVPSSYLFKDPTKKKEGTLLLIKDLNQNEEGQAQQEPEFDWKDRLKSWKQMQTSKGAIKSFTERKKEIFDSSVMSILACLQTPMVASRIKKQVETVFLNASKRVAGLKLLGEIMGLELPLKHRYDLMNWFCSSLRGNKNVLTHYLDDLKGCGHHLEEKARQSFFKILVGLVKQVKESKEDGEIKAILNSLKWKYLARDHAELKNLDIFKTLHEGDGKKDSKLKKAWGRPLKQEVIANDNDKKLPKEVIDLFEQVFLLTVGRIIKPDTGSHMKLKQKGTSIPTLEKAVSVIDENVSEHLISQAFDVIFKEFERYIKIMKMFKGVDWTIYVKMRNKERKSGEAKKEYDQENLLDEEDLEEEKKKAEEEEKKKKDEAESGVKSEDKKEVVDESKESEQIDTSSKVEENKEGEKKDSDEKKAEDEGEQKEAEDLEEKEKQEAIKKQEERAEKEMKSIYKLYSESFLRRLLRLVEIFTSIATISPYPLSMVQRVANPHQLVTLLNLLILSSPRIKIVVLKVIQNLIKIAIPFEVFEETISIITKDEKSQAYEIFNKVMPSVQFEESKFLKFLYNYLLSVRHKMWTKSGIESEGQYAVTQELINMFRFLIDYAPQDELQSCLRKQIKTFLLQNPIRDGLLNEFKGNWNIEETDIVLSIFPSGSFSRLMTGSEAVYKDTQKVIILGFSEGIKTQQNFTDLDNDGLNQFTQTINCVNPSKQQVLVLYQGSGSVQFSQEIRSLELSSLVVKGKTFSDTEPTKPSLLYDPEVLSNLVKLLAIEVEEETSLSIRQAQVQILKMITYLIESERAEKNISKFIDFLQEQNLLKDLLGYIERNANKPQLNMNESTLPIDLMELSLTALRMKALESDQTLLTLTHLQAVVSKDDTITFFEPAKKEQKQSFLKNTQIKCSINERNLHESYKTITHQVTFYNDIKENLDILKSDLGIVMMSGEEIIDLADAKLMVKVAAKANIIVTNDIHLPKTLYSILNKKSTTSVCDPLNEKPIFIITSNDFKAVQERRMIEEGKLNQYQAFDTKQQQFSSFIDNDLVEWGGFTSQQINQVKHVGSEEYKKQQKEIEDQLKFSKLTPAEMIKLIKREDWIKTEVPQVAGAIPKTLHNHDMRKHGDGERTGYGCDGGKYFPDCISKARGRDGWIVGWVCNQGCNYDLCVECMQVAMYLEVKLKAEQKIMDSQKEKDKSIECIVKLLDQNEAPAALDKQQTNIKKLLVGKMAVGARKQKSIDIFAKDTYTDLGQKMWNESLKGKNIDEIINTKLADMCEKPSSQVGLEKKRIYENVLDLQRIKANTVLQTQYVSTINKLIRLHSRKAFITFLNNLDPIPMDLLHSLQDLNKTILIAYNEGLQIKILTGNSSVLKNVKQFMKRLAKESYMRDFFNEFLITYVVNASPVIVKKMIEDKSFLSKLHYESEVDAQMYPNPNMIVFLIKLLLRESPEIIYETRGVVPNLISLLVGIAVASIIKNPSESNLPTLMFESCVTLLSKISSNPSEYKYIQDIANHTLLFNIRKEFTKFNKTKKSEQIKLLQEIYFLLVKISQQYQKQTQKCVNFEIKKQSAKFYKKMNYLLTKDPTIYYQLSKEDNSIMNHLKATIGEIKKPYKSHPAGYKTPFIAKVKAIQNADSIMLNISSASANEAEDKFVAYFDAEGKYRYKQIPIAGDATELHLRNYVYVGFSSEIVNTLFTFGDNKGGRLGNMANVPQDIKSLKFEHEVEDIQSCKQHSIIVTSNKEVYFVGRIKEIPSKEEFTLLCKDVKLASVGRSNVVLVQNDNTLLFMGKSKNNHFDKSNVVENDLYKQTLIQSIQEDSIANICSGTHFTAFSTQSGVLYAMGDSFTSEYAMQEEGVEGKVKKIKLPENCKALRVWCSRGKNQQVLIVEIQEKDSKYLMSIGKSESGLLGQDGQVTESKELQKLSYNSSTTQITQLSLLNDHALALSAENELFGWGSNDKLKLGFDIKAKNIYQPTSINFFLANKNKYKIEKISAGMDVSFIAVKEFSEATGNKDPIGFQLFSMGMDKTGESFLHRGVTKLELKEQQNIAKVRKFENMVVKVACAGDQGTFIYIGKQNSKEEEEALEKNKVASFYDQHIKHEIKKGKYVNGILHFFYDENSHTIQQEKSKGGEEDEEIVDPLLNGWNFISQKDKVMLSHLPDISFAIKHPIQNFQTSIPYFKEIIDQAKQCLSDQIQTESDISFGITCGETGKEIKSVRYYAAYEISETIKEINLSQDAFMEPTEYDFLPQIYYRIKKPLKEGAKLPMIDLSKIFNIDSNFKFEMSSQAEKWQYYNKQAMIEFAKSVESSEIKRQFMGVMNMKENRALEQQILSFLSDYDNDTFARCLDDILVQNDKEIKKFINKSENTLNDEMKQLIKQMTFLTNDNYSEVTTIVTNNMKFYQNGMKMQDKISERSIKYDIKGSLPLFRKQFINVLPINFKKQMLKDKINNLPTGSSFGICLRRRKAQAFAEAGNVDHEGMHTIFGQVMQEIKKSFDNNVKCFLINTSDSRIFSVEFKGEGSIDQGGPYRDTLTNLCNELQSPVLPLLIPTANNKNNHGQNRECWQINPTANSPSHLEMFKFLGYFLGMAIRSEQALPLDLAPIFWKCLLEEHISQSEEEKELDLKAIDTYSWQVLDDLRHQASSLPEEEFNSVVSEKFTTFLSDGLGDPVEICPGGREKQVTLQNLNEYIKLVIETRLNEAQKQVQAIIEGVNFVIPISLCRLLNWKQIERRATGSKVLDLVHLKSITVYENCSAGDQYVQQFWDALESYTDEERSLYLKFVWGRARMPATTDQKHKLNAVTYNERACLPVSHTCFFTLDLPKYPTLEMCRKNILFAIMFCGDIDADRSSSNIADED